jgi:transposase
MERMTMLAEAVDAVVGGDTHRNAHALEMLAPNGTTIATTTVSNDDDGFADVIAWIAEHVPAARVAVGLEGTHSYGVGLARALAAASLVVVEVQPPRRGPLEPRQVRPRRCAPRRAAGPALARRKAAGAAC